MERYFHLWIDGLAACIEAAAACVIGFAALEAIVNISGIFPRPLVYTTEAARLRLARWLSLAIEFELAADVLRTAIAPAWSDLGKLGAIVIIRTD